MMQGVLDESMTEKLDMLEKNIFNEKSTLRLFYPLVYLIIGDNGVTEPGISPHDVFLARF